MGRTVAEVFPPPVAQNIMAALLQAAGKGSSTGTQLCLDMGGDDSWFELSIARKPGATPADDRYIVLSRDITDRKRAEIALLHSEQSFRHFFDAGLVGMAISLPNQHHSLFNQRLAEILGRNGRDMYRQTWAEMTHPDDLALEEPLFADILAGRREGYTLDKRYLRPDGSVVHAALAVRCERDAQGQVTRFFVIVEDITQRELAKAELARHREHLEHLVAERSQALVAALASAEAASRAKSEFLSRMSHELRTPLNAIQGFSQLLELDPQLAPQSQRHVQEIRGASHHLLNLINDVLDLAQVESGKIGLAPQALPVAELLADVLTLLQPLAQRRAVQFQVQAQPGLLMRADRTRLKQVLLNLVSNAIKYNREGGGVTLIAQPADGEQVRVTVRDTGNGIPPERQGQLFEPFNRLGAEVGAVEGSGIGLSICRRLVDAMGGRIGVQSAPGQGSEFWLELPRASTADPAPAAEPSAPRVPLAPLQLRPATVLCVEDNEVNLVLIEQIMARHPMLRLVTATTATEGRLRARELQPDLMLLDIGLPDMDGHALMALLRQDPLTAHIPTVAVTANALPADIDRAMKSGFDHFLPKPIDLVQFDAMLQRILGVPEPEPDLFSPHDRQQRAVDELDRP
jgi:PAS domain S-box-containing protein